MAWRVKQSIRLNESYDVRIGLKSTVSRETVIDETESERGL